MNTKCKCGGTLQKAKWQEMSLANVIVWECTLCGNSVTQRKRRPYKLDAKKDIVIIREHIAKLLKRNPISRETAAEWWRFLTEFWGVYRGLQTKLTQQRIKETNDNTGD